MKKAYEKPMVAIENFILSQAISACDNIKVNHGNAACVLQDPDSNTKKWMVTFAKQGYFIDGCDLNASGMDTEDGICYHTSIVSAFTS